MTVITSYVIALFSAQHVKALPPTRRFDPTPGEAPEVSKKRAEDKMRGIHKRQYAYQLALRLSVAPTFLILLLHLRVAFGGSNPTCDVADRGV